MIRIAVLGFGRIGVMHAANIAAHPRATLAGVYDLQAPTADEMARKTGAEVFSSVEAVLIATATDTRADLLEMAVAAGKPVFCERRTDLSLARVNACAAAIAGRAVPIRLGFVRRVDPGHGAERKAIARGDIGELHQVVITCRAPWLAPEACLKVSGGILRDMTIHGLAMARFILGEDVTEVLATGSWLVDPALMERLGDHDTVTVVLTKATGTQAITTKSRRATYGYDQRVEALGTTGMAICENRRPHKMTLHRADFTEQAEPLLNCFSERYREAFDAEFSEFVDAVESGRVPSVGFKDGRLAQVLAEAAQKPIPEARGVSVKEIA